MNILLTAIILIASFIMVYKIIIMVFDFITQGTKLGKQLRKEAQIEAVSSVFIAASTQYFDMLYKGIISTDYGYLTTVSLKKLMVLLGGSLKECDEKTEKIKKELGITTLPSDKEISEILKKWEKKYKDGNDTKPK